MKTCEVCGTDYCSFIGSEDKFLPIHMKGHREAYAYPSNFSECGLILFYRVPESRIWYSSSDQGRTWRKIGAASPNRKEIANHLEAYRIPIIAHIKSLRVRKDKKSE
jgi:hypothetical protein